MQTSEPEAAHLEAKTSASDSFAAYVARASSELAAIARDQGLNTLGFILEMAGLEASAAVRRSSPVSTETADFQMVGNCQPADRLSAATLIDLQMAALALAHQRLGHAADDAEEALARRRAALREVARSERIISRRQAEIRRNLKRLVKQVA